MAGGEVAVADEVADRLPMDRDDYVTLDPSPAGRVHVGALVEQAGQIDMVVNDKRGEALGMTPGNALLVHTGQTAPEALRGPIAQVVGQDASVQNLDAVARFGLDPDAFESAVLVGDFADAGLARRIEPAGHAGTFELRVGDNHHHVVCTGCGRIDDVDCVVGAAPCLHMPEQSGFLIETAEVTFWGVCSDCRAKSEAEKPRGSR